MAVYGRNIYSDQNVYIGTWGDTTLPRLLGVQGFDGDWSLPVSNISAAGYGPVADPIEGELEGTVNVTRYVTRSSDPITGLLTAPVSGFLAYGSDGDFSKSFGFARGYVDSLSCSCAVGDVATSDFSMTIYGGFGKTSTTTSSPSEGVEVARAGDINLNVNGYVTNAVQSYDFALAIQRTPLNTLGNNFKPEDFIVNYPIEVSADFDIIVNDYETSELYDLICSPVLQDLTFELNTCSGTNIRKFSMSQAKLISYNTSSAIGDNMTTSISYVKYLKSTGDLAALFQ